MKSKFLKIFHKRTKQAMVFVCIGLLLILLSIVFHSFHLIDTKSANLIMLNDLFVNIFSHVGIGFLAVGLISIMLDMEHWIHYFEERLSKIVVEKKYLENLDNDSLINLQVEVLKAYFKNDSIGGSDGFLRYYQKNIQSIIGMPFRINVQMNIQILNYIENPELLEIHETMSYTCKMNSGKIQKTISYIPEEGEHYKTIDFSVILQHNDLKGVDDADGNGKIFYNHSKIIEKNLSTSGNGFEIDISKYNYNGLYVIVKATYLINKFRFFAWRMSQPTRNLSLNLVFPSEFNLEREFFIHNSDVICEDADKTNGLYNLNINAWLMPDEGITFQLAKNINIM